MANTPNYDLEKPGVEEFYDVNVQNNNMDKIDMELKKTNDSFSDHVEDGAAHGIGDKTTLATTHKNTIVGAINEAFTLGNSRKEELVDKLLLLDPSLPISYTSTWEEILQETGSVSTGKKYASGTVVSSPGSSPNIPFQYAASTSNTMYPFATVTDIPFKPEVIILTSENGSNRYLSVYSEGNDSYYPKTVKVSQYNGTNLSSNTFNFKGDVQGAVVSEGIFTLPVFGQGHTYQWEAWGG